MNSASFAAHAQAFFTNCKVLLGLKGGEYSHKDDRLANFRRRLRPGQVPLTKWDTYAFKHVDGIDSFITKVLEIEAINYSSKSAKSRDMLALFQNQSEPIYGRFHDLTNYLILGAAILKEIEDEALSYVDEDDRKASRFAEPAEAQQGSPAEGSPDAPKYRIPGTAEMVASLNGLTIRKHPAIPTTKPDFDLYPATGFDPLNTDANN